MIVRPSAHLLLLIVQCCAVGRHHVLQPRRVLLGGHLPVRCWLLRCQLRHWLRPGHHLLGPRYLHHHWPVLVLCWLLWSASHCAANVPHRHVAHPSCLPVQANCATFCDTCVLIEAVCGRATPALVTVPATHPTRVTCRQLLRGSSAESVTCCLVHDH